LILALLEIGVFRQRWFWAAVPRSEVGTFYVLEERIRTSGVKPRIVLFGDSRLRAAVTARYVAEELGVKHDEVLNLALAAGTPWDAKVILRRNPTLLDSAVLVLYQPSVWQFNENYPPGNRVRRFATLAERLAYKRFSTRAELFLGYFFHIIAARQVTKGLLDRLFRNLTRRLRGRYTEEPALIDPVTGRVRIRLEESDTGPASVNIDADIESFYADFRYSSRTKSDMEDLIAVVQKKDVTFFFLDIPTRDVYTRSARDKYSQYCTEYRDSLESIAAKYGISILGDSMTKHEAGITENLYYDYGHLTLEGMRRYSSWLAFKLKNCME